MFEEKIELARSRDTATVLEMAPTRNLRLSPHTADAAGADTVLAADANGAWVVVSRWCRITAYCPTPDERAHLAQVGRLSVQHARVSVLLRRAGYTGAAAHEVTRSDALASVYLAGLGVELR